MVFAKETKANLDPLIYQFREPRNAAHDLHIGLSATNEGTRATTQSLMSLMTKKTRIDAKRVAEIIGCSRKTVLNGGAGTAQLTRIRNGSTQVRFILEEVLAFAEKQERDAQRRLPKGHLTITS